jgi:hypothetical protein
VAVLNRETWSLPISPTTPSCAALALDAAIDAAMARTTATAAEYRKRLNDLPIGAPF